MAPFTTAVVVTRPAGAFELQGYMITNLSKIREDDVQPLCSNVWQVPALQATARSADSSTRDAGSEFTHEDTYTNTLACGWRRGA